MCRTSGVAVIAKIAEALFRGIVLGIEIALAAIVHIVEGFRQLAG